MFNTTRHACKDSAFAACLIAVAISPASWAQGDGDGGASDLAKKLTNPVASLFSVPFQFNYDEGFGPKDAGALTLNIQPVIPFSLNEDGT